MLISTFEAYFEGKKELFDGLAIFELETKWEKYPVLHLDLNAKKYETSEDLNAILNQYLEQWESIYGNEKKDRTPEGRFTYIIQRAYDFRESNQSDDSPNMTVITLLLTPTVCSTRLVFGIFNAILYGSIR
ncbi:hypothetical protein FACS1894207_0220 [Bacteroidia bacterium]|nr:hypothetical protein FACS1894207_0220 [Bacteroidia bacterium]